MFKILHLTHTDIRSDARILKEMQAAKKAGYAVYGIGISLDEGTKNVDTNSYYIRTLDIFSKKLKFLPKPIRHFFTLIEFFVKSLFYAIKIKADIIHCNDTLVLPVGAVVKFFSKSKLIYDAHELESDRNGLSRLLGKATLLLEKKLWFYIDGLIVVSPSIESWYIRNLGEKNSVVILNSPVFSDRNDEDKNYLRKKFKIPEESKIFIYVGILGAGRGIDTIVEAFKKNKKSHVVFLGYGDYSDKLKILASKFHNIHVHDPVDHRKVVSIARSADIGLCLIQNVSLSDYYCLPNKLFEYSFSGLSVLASNFPDISQVVQNYGIGLCVDLSEESINNGISEFEQDKVPYLAKPEKLKELSWSAQEVKLIDFYSKVK